VVISKKLQRTNDLGERIHQNNLFPVFFRMVITYQNQFFDFKLRTTFMNPKNHHPGGNHLESVPAFDNHPTLVKNVTNWVGHSFTILEIAKVSTFFHNKGQSNVCGQGKQST
jgi:hypothetical protein